MTKMYKQIRFQIYYGKPKLTYKLIKNISKVEIKTQILNIKKILNL